MRQWDPEAQGYRMLNALSLLRRDEREIYFSLKRRV